MTAPKTTPPMLEPADDEVELDEGLDDLLLPHPAIPITKVPAAKPAVIGEIFNFVGSFEIC